MSSKVYRDSPFGIANYPHLNKADTKFNTDGLYHVKLAVSGEDGQKLADQITAAANDAFKEYFENGDGKNLSEKEKAKYSVYLPFEEDEEKPGTFVFDFKQNASIKMRDGTVRDVKIGIYDANGDEMDKLVRGGSDIRVNFSMRPIPMKSLKQVGVRLDFGRVQVRKLSEGSGGGFGKVDGYVDDGKPGKYGDEPKSDEGGAADY